MPSRRRSITALLVAPIVAGLMGLAPAAGADPTYPSEQEVTEAYRAVETTAAKVGRLEAELARASGDLAALQVEASKAVEAFNAADAALADAREPLPSDQTRVRGRAKPPPTRPGSRWVSSPPTPTATVASSPRRRWCWMPMGRPACWTDWRSSARCPANFECALDRYRATSIAADLYAEQRTRGDRWSSRPARRPRRSRGPPPRRRCRRQVGETDRLAAQRESLSPNSPQLAGPQSSSRRLARTRSTPRRPPRSRPPAAG